MLEVHPTGLYNHQKRARIPLRCNRGDILFNTEYTLMATIYNSGVKIELN